MKLKGIGIMNGISGPGKRKDYSLNSSDGDIDIDFASIMGALDIDEPKNVKKLQNYLDDPIKNKNTYIRTTDGRYFELSEAINEIIDSQFPNGFPQA